PCPNCLTNSAEAVSGNFLVSALPLSFASLTINGHTASFPGLFFASAFYSQQPKLLQTSAVLPTGPSVVLNVSSSTAFAPDGVGQSFSYTVNPLTDQAGVVFAAMANVPGSFCCPSFEK